MTARAETRIVNPRRPVDEPLSPVIVQLTSAELAALSFVAVVVTSAVDVTVINAADRGLRKLREAAAGHPALPMKIRERP